MAEQHKSKPKFVPAAQVTTRAKDGSPPPWALGVMVAIIGFVVLMYSAPGIAYAIFPFARADWFWIGLVFLPLAALIVVAVASKGLDFQRAKAWTTVTGRIVRSELVAKHHRFQGSPETVENVPVVEYEFTVGARKYRGSRIGIGDDSGGANAEATLARYVVGHDVTVYYDPNDPRNCALERDGPFAHADDATPVTASAMAAALPAASSAGRVLHSVINLALLGAIVVLIVWGPGYVETHFPKGEGPVSIFAACFGLAALMLFLAVHRRSKQAQGWPKVAGEIVRSEVESFREMTGGHTTTMYRPAVEYAYEVRRLALRGTQIKLDATVSGTQAYAEKVTAKYPVGAAVEVHYDPDNPGTAALENPTGMTWLVAGVAAFCLAIAVYTLGIFR
jgi:hypothetical protein